MRVLARIGVAAVAVAATVVASAVVPALRAGDPEPAETRPSGGADVAMNQIQFMGAHNAYHREMQGAELAESLKIDPGLPGWAYYSHASIPDLLERQHVRHVELDLLPDPAGGLYTYPLPRQRAGLGPIDDPDMALPGMKVQHVPDVDYTTTCRTFVRCLTQVRTWSTGQPRPRTPHPAARAEADGRPVGAARWGGEPAMGRRPARRHRRRDQVGVHRARPDHGRRHPPARPDARAVGPHPRVAEAFLGARQGAVLLRQRAARAAICCRCTSKGIPTSRAGPRSRRGDQATRTRP